MVTLLERLTNHDWYYGYSDDHRVWKRGQRAFRSLTIRLEELGCPYDIGEIRKTVQKMILEDFVEEEPNQWYRHPRKYKNVAPARREDLIEKVLAEEITTWIESADESG